MLSQDNAVLSAISSLLKWTFLVLWLKLCLDEGKQPREGACMAPEGLGYKVLGHERVFPLNPEQVLVPPDLHFPASEVGEALTLSLWDGQTGDPALMPSFLTQCQ